MPSLFTNVLVNEAVQVICDRLQQDGTLEDRTTLSSDRVVDLLDVPEAIVLQPQRRSSSSNGKGQQWAHLSLLRCLTCTYMEFFEELTLRTAPLCLWKRYVDDTCCIIKKGTMEELLTRLNNMRTSIRFTVEVEKDGRLHANFC